MRNTTGKEKVIFQSLIYEFQSKGGTLEKSFVSQRWKKMLLYDKDFFIDFMSKNKEQMLMWNFYLSEKKIVSCE